MKKQNLLAVTATVVVLMTGCGATDANMATETVVDTAVTTTAFSTETASIEQTEEVTTVEETEQVVESSTEEQTGELPNIYLRLGETESRPLFEIELIDNEVSERFVRILQQYTRVIPLYVFDGSEHTDVLQFYDIPSSYDIPDGEPQLVTSEKAGEVYYSAGRIMIFYQDAEIEGNYVKIGETLTTEGLADAVNSNPLDDWGNRRVTIGIMGGD